MKGKDKTEEVDSRQAVAKDLTSSSGMGFVVDLTVTFQKTQD